MAAKDECRRRSNTAYGSVTEERLRFILDRDRSNNSIVSIQNNKISRSHYAQQLGCSRSALTQHIHIFEEFERKVKILSGLRALVPEMCEWIQLAYDSRKLELRGYKLERSLFIKHFNLPNGQTISNYSEIRLLFEKLDLRAKKEGYVPLSMQQELDRIKIYLADSPVLNKDRKSICLKSLAENTRVKKNRFLREPFAKFIADRQAEILAEVKLSKVDPYIHGRVYPFSHLQRQWPLSFLERIGGRFKQITESHESTSVPQPHAKLVAALEWIGSSSNHFCRAIIEEVNRDDRVNSADNWEDALFAYREYVIANATTDSSADNSIKLLRPSLDGLSSGGIFPATSIPLPGVKHARRRTGHLKSLAENSGSMFNEAGIDYVEFASAYFGEVCRNSITDMGKGDQADFIQGIAVELRASKDLPIDPALAVKKILEFRLNVLCTEANKIVGEAIKNHAEGQRLLSQAKIDGAEFESKYLKYSTDLNRRRQLVVKYFPFEKSDDQQIEQGLANLLALIKQQYGGIPPVGVKNNFGANSQFFNHLYLKHGGLKKIIPLLIPSSNAVSAALTLYLIESGANISVGRTLDRDCMVSSDLEGYCRITGHKARAKGKPIIVDLPEESDAVCAIKWLQIAGVQLNQRLIWFLSYFNLLLKPVIKIPWNSFRRGHIKFAERYTLFLC